MPEYATFEDLDDEQAQQVALTIICPRCAAGSWSPEYFADAYSLIARKRRIAPRWLYVSEPTPIPGRKLITIRAWLRAH